MRSNFEQICQGSCRIIELSCGAFLRQFRFNSQASVALGPNPPFAEQSYVEQIRPLCVAAATVVMNLAKDSLTVAFDENRDTLRVLPAIAAGLQESEDEVRNLERAHKAPAH